MISVFELFKIGLGPSSSHTVGPMKAAKAFVTGLARHGDIVGVQRIEVTLYGSLAWTGKGHGTDRAVLLGLAGCDPATVDPAAAEALVARAKRHGKLKLDGRHDIAFDAAKDIVFDTVTAPPRHPNTVSFAAFGPRRRRLFAETWHSVGGGFISRDGEADPHAAAANIPYPFRNAAQLLEMGRASGLSIAAMVRANELAAVSDRALDTHLQQIVATMMAGI